VRIHSKRFSQVIKKNGIKVEDLAASIVTPGKGINNQAKAEAAIRNWMRGSDHPRATAEHIKKLAAALGVAPASIAKFTALYRFERGSNRKTKLLTDLIRGTDLVTAENLLTFNIKKAAVDVKKALKAATDDAQRFDADTLNLIVEEASADEGPMMKRFHQKDRGRAHRILKRMTHITVSLVEKN
jgi:large subunit ribosomal protein L22